MRYLLDISVIIDLLRGDAKLVSFITDRDQDTITTSSVCLFEIYRGIYKLRDLQKRVKAHKQIEDLVQSFSHVVSCDIAIGQVAGQIWADVTSRGQSIEDIDILIAASALSTQATLVTRNVKHFTRVTGLTVLSV